MKLQITALLEAQKGFEGILKKDMPIVLSYKLSKILKAIKDEAKLYNDQRNGLIKKLGAEFVQAGSEDGKAGKEMLKEDWAKLPEKDKKTLKVMNKYTHVLPENTMAFQEELQKLNDLEIEIDVEPFPLKALEALKDVQGEHIEKILPFIKEK